MKKKPNRNNIVKLNGKLFIRRTSTEFKKPSLLIKKLVGNGDRIPFKMRIKLLDLDITN